MAKRNLVSTDGTVVATSPESTAPVSESAAPESTPEVVESELTVYLDRTWPDGAGAYVIPGIVGKIYVKPNYFSGPPPATLKLVGVNLIPQPEVKVKAVKVMDPEKVAKVQARIAKLQASIAPAESGNAFAGLCS